MIEQELEYTRTNESLAAIIVGLDLQETDDVYAVGGSGDAVFAFLEFVRSVVAIDKNPKQVELMEKRKNYLASIRFHQFLEVDEAGTHDDVYLGVHVPDFGRFNLNRRNAYFLRDRWEKKDRLVKIAKKVDSLEIIEGDFFEGLGIIDPVSKIYLSNIRHPYLIGNDLSPLDKMFDILSPGGLIYFSDRHIFSLDMPKRYGQKRLPKGMSIDEKLTSQAVDIEINSTAAFGKDRYPIWYPLVLRKE